MIFTETHFGKLNFLVWINSTNSTVYRKCTIKTVFLYFLNLRVFFLCRVLNISHEEDWSKTHTGFIYKLGISLYNTAQNERDASFRYFTAMKWKIYNIQCQWFGVQCPKDISYVATALCIFLDILPNHVIKWEIMSYLAP